MDIIFGAVAGLDVHKASIVACVRKLQPRGDVTEWVESFGTMTCDLLRLSDWLKSHDVTHVAMEATGVFWKPIWNVLDGHFQLLLTNPRELKQVPGRKSDINDAQWIAHLQQCGLLRSSFVPDRPQRELRDLTRQRTQWVGERTRAANRIHKTLEDANVKLGAVASDILGVSARAMLKALVAGERDPAKLAQLAHGALRRKIPALTQALQGHWQEHHTFLLQQLLAHVEHLEAQIEAFNERIEKLLLPFVDEAMRQRLDQIPGVNQRTIENVVAEIGADMTRFPSAGHLSSWAGICPGNEESAGKRIRKRTTKGNGWLRRALTEAAWAASHAKGSYLQAQYRRLAARRGKKRALVAVAHTLLVTIYHMLKQSTEYKDLGSEHFSQLNPEQYQRYLVRRLQSLGFEVTLKSKEPAA